MMLKKTFNWKDVYGRGRCCMLASATLQNLLGQVITGTFYVAFLSANGFSLYEVSILAALLYAASFFSFFSAAILERFERRKAILGIGKLIYYILTLVGMTVIPMLVTERNALMVVFSVFVFLSGLLNSIISGGYLAWNANFLKGEAAPLYFSMNQISCNLVGSIVAMVLSSVVDKYAVGDNAQKVFFTIRAVALVLAAADVIVLFSPKEFPYKRDHKTVNLKNLITIPFNCKKFIITTGIYCIWSGSLHLTDTVSTYFLQNEVGVELSLLNLYMPIATVLLIFTSGLWRKVLQKISWLATFAVAGLIHAPSSLMLAFVTSENYRWLYVLAVCMQAIAGVGLNLSALNMAYVNTPDVDQTYYLGFYSMIVNLAGLLGKLISSAVIKLIGDNCISLGGMEFGSVRFLMLCQFGGYALCCLLFLLNNQKLIPDRELAKAKQANTAAVPAEGK